VCLLAGAGEMRAAMIGIGDVAGGRARAERELGSASWRLGELEGAEGTVDCSLGCNEMI
jgi:hypothetical protein